MKSLNRYHILAYAQFMVHGSRFMTINGSWFMIHD